MPLFALLIVLLFPKPSQYWVLKKGKTVEEAVYVKNPFWAMYNKCHDKVLAWHRAALEKMDFNFRFQQASLRLVRARQEADEKGIGPLDSQYPDLFDFMPPTKIELPK